MSDAPQSSYPSKWCKCQQPEPKHQTEAIDVCLNCSGLTAVRVGTFEDLEAVRQFIHKVE